MLVVKILVGLIYVSRAYAFKELFCSDDENFFYCGRDGEDKCIPVEWTCDYVLDCPNGKDEINCHYMHSCSKGDFMCANGPCIPADHKCDNHPDCEDNSDEKHCHSVPKAKSNPSPSSVGGLPHLLMHVADSTVNKCGTNEFSCGDDISNQCIPTAWKCDYVRDCPNGRDEDSCDYPTHCKEGEFLCHNGQCIDAKHKCDNIAFCDDHSDESFCNGGNNSFKKPSPKNDTTFQQTSPQRPRSVPQRQPKAANSSIGTCHSVAEFFCQADNRCIGAQLRCNGQFDCPSGEDEIGCSICENNGLKTCADGFGCYYHECDNFRECADGSDEKNCDFKPRNDQSWPNPPKAASGQCDFLKEYQETMASYMQTTMVFMHKMATPPPCPQADSESTRSLLIEGIPEPYMESAPSNRRAQDLQAITIYLDRLGTDAYPDVFYRVGSYNAQRVRGIKLIFPTQDQSSDVLNKHATFKKLYPRSTGINIKPVN